MSAALAPQGPTPCAAGFPQGQSLGRDLAVLGRCSGGGAAGKGPGEWQVPPLYYSHPMFTLAPRRTSQSVVWGFPWAEAFLRPRNLHEHIRGHTCPTPASRCGAAVGSAEGGSPTRPTVPTAQWCLRGAWRSWRRVLQLRWLRGCGDWRVPTSSASCCAHPHRALWSPGPHLSSSQLAALPPGHLRAVVIGAQLRWLTPQLGFTLVPAGHGL